MLFHRANSLVKGGFTLENYLNIADALCHAEMEVSPVFECIKVFARIGEDGNFTYARHQFDLGTIGVDRYQITNRIKDSSRREVVLSALCEVEEKCTDIWPFANGSATWVLLEILHPEIRLASAGNKPTVIFRTANRISSKGTLSETTLTKRLFSQFENTLPEIGEEFSFAFNPTIRLSNISGSGVYTKFCEEHNGVMFLVGDNKQKLSDIPKSLKEHYEESFLQLITDLLECNFSLDTDKNPGFIFSLNEQLFKVQGPAFEAKRKNASKKPKPNMPLPFGYRK